MSTKDEKTNLSVVIIAKNEEKNLKDCLESCNFAKEIILVDDNSTDKTVEIAQNFGAKIFNRSMDGNWGEQQTFAINQSTMPWILLLDCDERITPELREEIISVVKTNEKVGYEIKRKNFFKYHRASHGTMRPDWVPRLFPNENVRVEGQVHPTLIYPYKLQRLKGTIIHFPYDNPDQYYRKLNQYCKLSAEKYLEKNKRFSFFRDVVLRPFWAAFKVYFVNLGFLDGKIGFVFAANHYSYTLQKYVRYYLLKNSGGKF